MAHDENIKSATIPIEHMFLSDMRHQQEAFHLGTPRVSPTIHSIPKKKKLLPVKSIDLHINEQSPVKADGLSKRVPFKGLNNSVQNFLIAKTCNMPKAPTHSIGTRQKRAVEASL